MNKMFVTPAVIGGLVAGAAAVTLGAALVAGTYKGVKHVTEKFKNLSAEEKQTWREITTIYETNLWENGKAPTSEDPRCASNATILSTESMNELESQFDSMTLSLSFWKLVIKNQTANGRFTTVALDAVSLIIMYVNNAKLRRNFFRENYSLPRHFVLHEFLTFFVYVVCNMSGGDNAKNELKLITRRLKYLRGLQATDRLRNKTFLCFHENKITMAYLLQRLMDQLNVIRKDLQETVLQNTAIYLISEMSTKLKDIIRKYVELIVQVVSKEHIKTFALVMLFDDADAKTQYPGLYGTRRWFLLQPLLNLPAVRTSYLHEPMEGGDDDSQFTENDFFQLNGSDPCTPRIPPQVWADFRAENAKRNNLKRRKIDDRLDGVGQESILAYFADFSGVFKDLKQDPNVMCPFVALHGYTVEVCFFYHVMEKLKKVAGHGGSVLAFGLLSRHLKYLMRALETVVKKQQEVFQQLQVALEDVHRRYNQNSRKECPWRYTKVTLLIDDITDTQEEILETAFSINVEVKRGLGYHVRQMELAVNDFWKLAAYSMRRVDHLNIGFKFSDRDLRSVDQIYDSRRVLRPVTYDATHEYLAVGGDADDRGSSGSSLMSCDLLEFQMANLGAYGNMRIIQSLVLSSSEVILVFKSGGEVRVVLVKDGTAVKDEPISDLAKGGNVFFSLHKISSSKHFALLYYAHRDSGKGGLAVRLYRSNLDVIPSSNEVWGDVVGRSAINYPGARFIFVAGVTDGTYNVWLLDTMSMRRELVEVEGLGDRVIKNFVGFVRDGTHVLCACGKTVGKSFQALAIFEIHILEHRASGKTQNKLTLVAEQPVPKGCAFEKSLSDPVLRDQAVLKCNNFTYCTSRFMFDNHLGEMSFSGIDVFKDDQHLWFPIGRPLVPDVHASLQFWYLEDGHLHVHNWLSKESAKAIEVDIGKKMIPRSICITEDGRTLIIADTNMAIAKRSSFLPPLDETIVK